MLNHILNAISLQYTSKTQKSYQNLRHVNLSIKILVPFYETRFSILAPARRGATGFSRRVSLKEKNVVGGSRLKGVQKSPTEGLVKHFADFCFKRHLPKCKFSLTNPLQDPADGPSMPLRWPFDLVWKVLVKLVCVSIFHYKTWVKRWIVFKTVGLHWKLHGIFCYRTRVKHAFRLKT